MPGFIRLPAWQHQPGNTRLATVKEVAK